ncbi:MAG: hypothetical protein Q8T11_01005 [Elusimicrobiota bacterium]|nr:hypothetical protein [Elusimicrobiota bacterium]
MAITMRRKHTKPATGMLAVEFPRQGETITSSDYTVRVFAPETAQKVGISIDQGPWKSCRCAVGYWWYDWSGFQDGPHQIVVSMGLPDGSRIISEPHEFSVELSSRLITP